MTTLIHAEAIFVAVLQRPGRAIMDENDGRASPPPLPAPHSANSSYAIFMAVRLEISLVRVHLAPPRIGN